MFPLTLTTYKTWRAYQDAITENATAPYWSAPPAWRHRAPMGTYVNLPALDAALRIQKALSQATEARR